MLVACAVCATPFERKGGTGVCCSPGCRKAHRLAASRRHCAAYRDRNRKPGPACVVCGGPCPRGAKTCPGECRDAVLAGYWLAARRKTNERASSAGLSALAEHAASRSEAGGAPRPGCAHCGAALLGRDPRAWSCSERCRSALYYARKRKRRKQ